MKCTRCHSHAINEHLHGRFVGNDGELCDVCYWRKRAESNGYGAVQSADTARIDWLASTTNTRGNVELPTSCVLQNPDSLRAAIDAAMRGE